MEQIKTIKFKENPNPQPSIIPDEIKVYIKKDKNYFQITDLNEKIVCIRPYKELLCCELSEDKLRNQIYEEIFTEIFKIIHKSSSYIANVGNGWSGFKEGQIRQNEFLIEKFYDLIKNNCNLSLEKLQKRIMEELKMENGKEKK